MRDLKFGRAVAGESFRYRLDGRCRTITWATAGALVAAGVLIWWLSPGKYLPVWFLSIAVAVVSLVAMSIPRRIVVTADAVEIRCVLEITHLPWGHLAGVRRVERQELGRLVPTFASPGFGGYFGYWFDVAGWDFVKVYASGWRGLVLIEDIYEQRYVVSADDPDTLCRAILRGMEQAEEQSEGLPEGLPEGQTE
jgi:hypothetical protein